MAWLWPTPKLSLCEQGPPEMLNLGKVMKGSGGRKTDLTLGNRNFQQRGGAYLGSNELTVTGGI